MPWPTSPTPEELTDEVRAAVVRLMTVPADLVENAEGDSVMAALEAAKDAIAMANPCGAVIALAQAQDVLDKLEQRAVASR